mmetsp:Transcript_49331/g.97996  ORF Transcript_49331/g.97996 Transcript_49331/m.97996 type:complete len:683 (-) Transcript_49331:115-2163(-)
MGPANFRRLTPSRSRNVSCSGSRSRSRQPTPSHGHAARRRQPLPQCSSSPSAPRPRKDSFGRSVAVRQNYGECSSSRSSPEQRRGRRRASDSQSDEGRKGPRGSRSMGAYGPGMFNPMMNPMLMGTKGMDMWQGMMGNGSKGIGNAGAMSGLSPGMFPPMWGWPGMPPDSWGRGHRDADDRRRGRRGRSRDRSHDRRDDRSRSSDRGKSVDYLRLPRQIMGRVIGKQGATINSIRESSGARIDAEDKDDDMCEFRIQGSPEAVERARTMILEVADKSSNGGSREAGSGDVGGGSGGGPDSGNTNWSSLDFPVSVMGGIIGARGAKISEIRQASGARVQVDKEEGRCHVTISGTSDQVARARSLVQNVADEEMHGTSGGGPQAPLRGDTWGGNAAGGGGGNAVSNCLEFPVSATGRIIGSRGAQISEVRQQSGAKVSIEKLDDCCKVQISGTPEQVDRARKMIISIADEGQSIRQAEARDQMEVPLSMVGRVIGRGGDTIQRLQRESGAQLDVNTNDGDPCLVRISGSRDACSRARFLIAEVLDQGSQFSDRGSGGGWGVGADAAAAWGPLPAYDGLPPPGDGNGSCYGAWQGEWGPMPGMWGQPPHVGGEGGLSGPWDLSEDGDGQGSPGDCKERDDRGNTGDQRASGDCIDRSERGNTTDTAVVRPREQKVVLREINVDDL